MKVHNLIPTLAISAMTLVSVPAMAQGTYEMVVNAEAKMGLFLQNSENSLHKTGDLRAYGSNYVLKHPVSQQGKNYMSWAGLPSPREYGGYTRISDGQCVTFAEWMTNTCNITTGDYIRGKQVIAFTNPSELRGRAIARFDCKKPNGEPKYCQSQTEGYGHIMIVLAAELDSSGKVQSAWVADSNSIPYANPTTGGVIAKRKVSYGELSRFYVVTYNKNPNEIKCN